MASVVNVSISLQATTPQAAGFGEVCIAASDCPAGFTERLRHYVGTGPTCLAQLVTDGFATSDATYLAASAVMAQSPSPLGFAVGRLVHKPTQKFTITPTYVAGKVYTVYVNGVAASFTGVTNLAATCTGIASAITALSVADITADGSSGTTVTIVHTTAGKWTRIRLNDPTIMSVVMDATDAGGSSGIADDLAAIALYDNTWYGLNLDTIGSAAIIAAAAAWVESNAKLLITQTMDQPCADLALSSGSDIMQTLKTAAYTRTATLYTHDNGNFAGCAWWGARAPKAPGSENWMFAVLAGVSATPLTGTQTTHLDSKYGNYYTPYGGYNITFNGRVASGQFIDNIRGIDWLTSIIFTAELALAVTTGNKIPFTDEGIAQVESVLRACLTQAVGAGFLATSPAPTVIAPKASSVSAANKSNRILPGVTFTATTAGAIDQINIVGTVNL